MAIENNYISPVNGERTVTPVENPVCVYTSYLGGSDVISSDEMNSYKTAKLVNPLGDRISLSLSSDSRQTAPDTTFPLYDDTRTYGFNSATLMPADPADELSFLSYALTVKDRNGVRAFTNIDFKRCLLSGSISYDEVDGKKRYSVGETFTLKYAYGEKTSFLDTNGSINDVEPAILFTKDNDYYGLELRSMRVSCYYTETTFEKTSNLGPDTTDFGYGTFIERLKRRAIWKAYERGMYPYDGYTEHQTVENMTYSIYHGGSSSGNNTNVVGYLNNEHDALLLIAGAGLAFEVDGVIYKPIVQGGVVVDFTSDMNEKSEWDKWTDFGSRTLPDAPGGGGGDDDSDSIDFGGLYGNGGAFSSFYIMNRTELANLRSWMNGVQISGADKIPMGLDPMQQIISLSEFPVDISATALAPENIVFRTIGVPEGALGPDVPIPAIVNTGVSAKRATGGTVELDLGSVEIPRYWEKNKVPFLDFETSIECYIPFCGVFGLDCQTVMGKTLAAKLYLSTATGACNCIVYTVASNGVQNPVAYGSGNMSSQLPISSNQWGTVVAATFEQRMSIAQAQSSAVSNLAKGLVSGVVAFGGGGGGAPGVGSGTQMAAGLETFNAFSNMATAPSSAGIMKSLARNKLQAIGTTFSGAFGTTASWSLPFKAYVKITRPNAKIPANYAHTEAIPQVEAKTLSACSGLTICVNPDISSVSKATQQERQIIAAALSNGVIV